MQRTFEEGGVEAKAEQMMREEMARRFERHVAKCIQQDKELLTKRLIELGLLPKPDTHDEWREMNDAPASGCR